MRSLGIPLAIVSAIPPALFIAAIVLPKWHTYQNFDSRVVSFGLQDVCVGDAEVGLSDLLRFDPCYLKSNGDNIMFCEYRVGTFGCVVSAAFCALLGLIFACWSLQHDRIPRFTWGSYYFVSLCHFIALLEGAVGVALYSHVMQLWNDNKQSKPNFEASTAYLCAIAGCVISLLLLITSTALAAIDKKKYAQIESMRDMNNKMLLISGKASTTSSGSSHTLLAQKSRAKY